MDFIDRSLNRREMRNGEDKVVGTRWPKASKVEWTKFGGFS